MEEHVIEAQQFQRFNPTGRFNAPANVSTFPRTIFVTGAMLESFVSTSSAELWEPPLPAMSPPCQISFTPRNTFLKFSSNRPCVSLTSPMTHGNPRKMFLAHVNGVCMDFCCNALPFLLLSLARFSFESSSLFCRSGTDTLRVFRHLAGRGAFSPSPSSRKMPFLRALLRQLGLEASVGEPIVARTGAKLGFKPAKSSGYCSYPQSEPRAAPRPHRTRRTGGLTASGGGSAADRLCQPSRKRG